MKKSLFGIAAVAALVGMVVIGTNLEAAGPKVTKPAKMKASDDFSPMTRARSQAAAGNIDFDYSTGFEANECFTPRNPNTCVQNPCGVGGYVGQCGFIGDGTQGCGPYPEPWAVSGSNTTNIEGHIDTVNPFKGDQHLRISKDICDNTNAFSFSVDARLPASPPKGGLLAPSTYKGAIALKTGLFGANVNWQPQSNSQGFLTSRVMFFFYGWFYILDDYGAGLTFVPVFIYWNNFYTNIMVHHDPCAKYMCLDGGANLGGLCPNGNIDCKNCVGGSNDGGPCVADFACPGGTCEGGNCYGRIEYYYGDKTAPIYVGTTYAGTTSEQFLIYTDNFPGDNDLDNLEIVTGEPCPTVCGNEEVEPGEDCDGRNDANCPGRCTDCVCSFPCGTCEGACDLANGTTTVMSAGRFGAWWTFVADTEATAVDFCGSAGHDSWMYVFTGSCNTWEFLAINDDCDESSPWSYGYADPLAPCHPVGAFPWEACTCWDTNQGQRYWVYDWRIGLGSLSNITLNKRQTCDVIWEGGACCDGKGGCTDKVLEADCQNKGDSWTAQKYCDKTPPCPILLGACCDHGKDLGGLCIDHVWPADCVGAKQDYHHGLWCIDILCDEATGACCDHVKGTCVNGTLSATCRDQNEEWFQETSCSQVNCDKVVGACLDYWNPDPLARNCLCTDAVTWNDCQGNKLEWHKGTACAALVPTCIPNFKNIPTVSEWGMVILTLLLLVGAKVYFGRRHALA